METKILVKDAMISSVVTAKTTSNISDAAKKMIDHQIGCLVVMDNKDAVGIITERDVVKLVAEKKSPEKTKIKSIMSSPIISVEPRTGLFDAARVMSKFNIRRLPVMEKKKLQGIITSLDIIRFAPEEADILSELAKINGNAPSEEGVAGECERCGKYSEYIKDTEGALLCQPCREESEEE